MVITNIFEASKAHRELTSNVGMVYAIPSGRWLCFSWQVSSERMQKGAVGGRYFLLKYPLPEKCYNIVLNNVKFKLILRMFAVVKRGEKYTDNYKKAAWF